MVQYTQKFIRNMIFFNIEITPILIYSSIVLQFCKVGDTNELFQVLANPLQVEELAVAYAEHEQTEKSQARGSSWFSRPKNICRCSLQQKINFCENIYRAEYHGFQSHLSTYEEAFCVPTKFFPRSITPPHSDCCEAAMFLCPAISYVDLLTDERITLATEYLYYVSGAREDTSAFVFFQESIHSPLYPLLYASNISFKKLKSPKEKKQRNQIIPQMNLDYSEASIESIADYFKVRGITLPYVKYRRTFDSSNVCGLRQSHRIYFCRQTMKKVLERVEFDTEGYDDDDRGGAKSACKKRTITVQRKYKNLYPPNWKIFALLCPPVIMLTSSSDGLLSARTKVPILYYLSSNLVRASATFYRRINRKGNELELMGDVRNLNFLAIIMDARRTKFTLYPPQYKRVRAPNSFFISETDINFVTGTVQMPSTIARYDELELDQLQDANRWLTIMRRRWFLEDTIISFSKARKINLVYEKFRKFYWSLDICQLTVIQRYGLCDEIFINAEYKFNINFEETGINYSCSKQEIALTSREAQNLESGYFSTWKCPPLADHAKLTFHIGKSHLKDAAFVYKNYNLDDENFPNGILFPDSLASNINRYSLADSELIMEAMRKISAKRTGNI